MEREHIMQVADTTARQLLALTPAPTLLSWGIRQPFIATIHKNMPALKFKVNGRLHKGYVIIALNEGIDYYEIYLQNGDKTTLVNEEVCFDELGTVIDEAIESGTDKAEYEKFCEAQLEYLLGNAE